MTAIDKLRTDSRRLAWTRIDPDGPGLHSPKKPGDIGFDLEAAEDVALMPGQQHDIATNIHIALPENVWAEMRARSSIAKRHLQVEAGTIDTGYRGPIFCVIRNITPIDVQTRPLDSIQAVEVKKGERIAQLIFHRTCPVWLDEVPQHDFDTRTERGVSGFGSTGR